MSNFWRDKQVFITGATGFLGSLLTKRLVEESANVVALVRDWNPQSIFHTHGLDKKINIVRGGIEDLELLRRALSEFQIDTCFHLAAQSQVAVANQSPVSTFETNIRGTWNILEAARQSSWLKRIVVATSDKAYGTHKKLPYTEDMCLQGDHPYEVSKSCADLIAQSYYHTYQLPVAVARLSNMYGGGDLNFLRIIPAFCQRLINGERPIINGDGSVVRDFLYIKDAVEAYLTLAEQLDKKEIIGQAFNFGNDSPLTLLEVTRLVIKASGQEIEPDVRPELKREGEIQEQYLSSAKAKRLLSWKPQFSMEEGLRRTYNWYKNFFASQGKI